MKKIVKGNDFTMLVRVMKVVDGGRVPFSLPSCEEVHAFAVGLYRKYELAVRVSASDDSVLLCRVEGDALPLGNYALEVSGKLFGNDWRSNEYGQFRLVDSNAEADTEFRRDLVEGEDSVEMDTAIVFLPPEAGLVELSERLRAGVLDDVRREIAGSLPVVDAELSVESSNAVMNRAVARALAEMREDMDFLHFVAMQRIGGKKEFTAKDFLGGQTRIPGRAFALYTELEKVTIPDGVTSIGEKAFNGCSALKSVTIPSSVKSIGRTAFQRCSALTEVNIPDGVTSIEDFTFFGCSALAKITIPESVKSIGKSAFNRCSSLTEVNIPDGVTSIKDFTFNGCSALTSVNIPKGVEILGVGAFQQCSSLKSVTIPGGVTNISDFAFNYCSALISVTIPSGVGSIGDCAFQHCASLTEVNIPDGVKSIGVTAFQKCTSLKSITIPCSVTFIGSGAFNGCYALTEVSIPDGVTSLGKAAFGSCSALKNVTIPSSVTSIGGLAFAHGKSLTAVTYKGTKEQWGNVSKGDNWNLNTPPDAVVHCTDGDVPLNG